MVSKNVSWLQKHPLTNYILIVVYFLFILLMHDPLVKISVWVEHQLTVETYNLIIAIVFISLLAGFLCYLFKHLSANPENRTLKLSYLFITVALLIVHSRFMFDSNIEVIHSFEFTILAFLIFPLFNRFGAAIFFTLPFMLIDEWYQYIILYPEWNDYFDLNDILTDTYGCALTMLLLMISGIQNVGAKKPLLKRPEFWGVISLVLVVVTLAKLCIVVPYAFDSCSNTLLVMNEGHSPETFWRAHPTHNINYHIMNPVEGFVAIITLHLFYLGLDRAPKTSIAPH